MQFFDINKSLKGYILVLQNTWMRMATGSLSLFFLKMRGFGGGWWLYFAGIVGPTICYS